MQPMFVWKLKFLLSMLIDAIDMLLGMIPGVGHAGEFIGIGAAVTLWGWRGAFYGLEMLDVTNVADGLVPTASIIGWSKKAEYEQRQLEWEARQRPPSSPSTAIVPAE